MKYYIGCKKGTALISWLIRLVTFSKYSHCLIYIKGNPKEKEVWEADGDKSLSYIPLDEKVKKQTDFYEIIEPFSEEELESYMDLMVGAKYDYLDLVRCLLIETSGIWKKFVRKIIPIDEKKLICSEAVREAFRYAGVDLCEGNRLPTPKDISKSKKLRKLTDTEKEEIFR